MSLNKLMKKFYVRMRDEEKMRKKLVVLFKELCCSQCKSDFKEESFTIMRKEDSMIVFKTTCAQCGKSFGAAFLGISDFDLKNYPEEEVKLKVKEGTKPIDSDEVLDAHKFIKELDTNWKDFISKLDDEE